MKIEELILQELIENNKSLSQIFIAYSDGSADNKIKQGVISWRVEGKILQLHNYQGQEKVCQT